MQQNQDTSNSSQQHIPNLDTIISQITNNDEFQGMMNNLSGELLPKKTNQESSENSDQSDLDDEPNNNYDLMATFFSDNDGNNICDILSNINNNLSELNKTLTNHLKK